RSGTTTISGAFIWAYSVAPANQARKGLPMPTRIAVIRPLPADLLQQLRQQGEVIDNQAGASFDNAGLIAHMAEADAALVTALDRIDAEVIANCPKLRVLANIGVGYNNIAVAACTERGIMVTNTPGTVD